MKSLGYSKNICICICNSYEAAINLLSTGINKRWRYSPILNLAMSRGRASTNQTLFAGEAWFLASCKLATLIFTYIYHFLVPWPPYYVRPTRFGSRGPRKFFRSSRIRHRNALTERAWKDAVQGLGNIYPMVSAMTSYRSLTSRPILVSGQHSTESDFEFPSMTKALMKSCLFIVCKKMFTIGESKPLLMQTEQQTQEP